MRTLLACAWITVPYAIAIAGEILGREVQLAATPAVDALQRVCQLVPERAAAVVRVHPDEAAVVAQAIADGLGDLSGRADVVGDPNIEAGGCIVDVGECRIDARIGDALDRVRRALA